MTALVIRHWPLGDHVCYTGLPAAYHHYFGEKLPVHSMYTALWENNPYYEAWHAHEGYQLKTEEFGRNPDWFRYRPQRVFEELTGIVAPLSLVNPKLYYKRHPISKRLIISDEAGWVTRRGYPHFDDLTRKLKQDGWDIHYFHKEERYGDREITFYDTHINELPLKVLIAYMATAEVYIGYDSGSISYSGWIRHTLCSY